MVTYGISAALACLFAFLAQRICRRNTLQAERQKGFLSWPVNTKIFFVIFAALSVLPFFLLSSLRYDVGTDYFYTYRPMYDQIVQGLTPSQTGGAIGRWLLYRAIVTLGGGHVWFFTIVAGVTLVFLFAGIYQQSPCPWMSVALFVLAEGFFISLNGSMQYMGMAIIFFGFKYVREQCFWKYAVFVLLGTFFHYSTIVFLPLYFLSKLHIKPWFGLITVAVLSLLNTPLRWLLTELVRYTPFSKYIGTEFHLSERLYPARLIVHAVILIVVFLYYYRYKNGENSLYRYFYYLELIAFFLLINRNIVPLADRLCWTLEISQLLYLPMVVISEQKRNLRIFLTVLLLCTWGSLCYYEIFTQQYHEVVPYQTILLPGTTFY